MPNSIDVREGRVLDRVIENGIVVPAGLQKTEMTLAEHNDYLDTRKQPRLTEVEVALMHGDRVPYVDPGVGVLRRLAETGAVVESEPLEVHLPPELETVGPPDGRGLRYPLEMNTKERSLLPADLQQIYEWWESPSKWIMRTEYRAKFAQGDGLI